MSTALEEIVPSSLPTFGTGLSIPQVDNRSRVIVPVTPSFTPPPMSMASVGTPVRTTVETSSGAVVTGTPISTVDSTPSGMVVSGVPVSTEVRSQRPQTPTYSRPQTPRSGSSPLPGGTGVPSMVSQPMMTSQPMMSVRTGSILPPSSVGLQQSMNLQPSAPVPSMAMETRPMSMYAGSIPAPSMGMQPMPGSAYPASIPSPSMGTQPMMVSQNMMSVPAPGTMQIGGTMGSMSARVGTGVESLVQTPMVTSAPPSVKAELPSTP